MGPLVTTEWLAGELGKPDLVVFDATKYLPNEPKDGKAEFLGRAHPRRALFRHRRDRRYRHRPAAHGPRPPGRFGKLMAAMGVGNASRRCVLRPEGPGVGGARLVADARVRPRQRRGAGRRAAEMARRGPVRAVRRASPRRRPAEFRPDLRAMKLRGVGDILRNVETRAELVLDARAAGRFTGAVAGAARRACAAATSPARPACPTPIC